MLESKKSEEGKAGYIFTGSVDTEDSATLAQFVCLWDCQFHYRANAAFRSIRPKGNEGATHLTVITMAFPSHLDISWRSGRQRMTDKRLEEAYQLGKEYEKTYRG
jgi:hypothetical protein